MKVVLGILTLYFVLTPLCAQGQNPFSIARSVADTIVETPVSDTEASDNTLDTKIEGENPFTISHIPIRKNQYKAIERLAIANDGVVEETISVTYFPLWILISSLCMLAYLLYHKKDHLLVLLRSISNENFMRMTSYEENGGRSIPYLIGYIIFILNAALFIYLYLTKHYGYNREYLFLMILGGVFLFFFGKHIVNGISSWVFYLQKQSKLYDFTIISIYNLLAVVFLSLNVVMVFGRQSWMQSIAVIGVIVFIIALLSRYYKGLRIGQGQLNSYFFHFFLYFCAFEFAPWILVYSAIKDLN